MEIKKELKETSKILDEIVPFQPNAKQQILNKIDLADKKRNIQPSISRYRNVLIAAAVVCITIGFSLSPLAAPYTEPFIKLFYQGKEVATVKNHHAISQKIDTNFNIEKELEKVKEAMKDGETKAVYIAENNPGVPRENGQPYNLTTVIQKPLSITNWDELIKEIQNKVIEEFLPSKNLDQTNWRRGKDIKLSSSILNYTFNKGRVSYAEGNYDNDSLIEEAKKTGKKIVTKDVPLTNVISLMWLQYKGETGSFDLALGFGESWASTEVPGLDKAKEVSKLKVGGKEAVYVDNGSGKDVYWVVNIDGKISNYNLHSVNLTKEELIKICQALI